ncbi:MAG: DNA mismatch repair protein MutS [Chitinophagaceae bacterium]|nr:DNA mismatch repair protein MutS [Chitinophagaceae bacterium]
MEIDKTTLADISIFNADEELSVFSKLNLCDTVNGKEQLLHNFSNPLQSVEEISAVQQIIKLLIENFDKTPTQITNGTIMVVEKFFTATIDEIPSTASPIQAINYKLLHGPDYSLVKYSAQHCFDFIKGMKAWVKLLLTESTSYPLKKIVTYADKALQKPQFNIVDEYANAKALSNGQLLQLAHFIRYNYKHNMHELIAVHATIDAWLGMARAVKKYNLIFPDFVENEKPVLEVKGLYHLLLPTPVAYDVALNQLTNFLFLTGANMAGKSTFIKSVGSAVFLAHTGMGVPATNMQLTYFDGLLSNINVVDNLIKGESYFYNEVQRIKATVTKISNGKKWLILIDELFKGTNVQDAMKCSATVIEGLHKNTTSIFILSTHLYEIAEDLKKYSNICFKYFETSIIDDQLQFSYQLKEGVSNDRLGYLILKKEGVVDMLEKL